MCEIKHRGYIDDIKFNKNMRILTMNIHQCRLKQYDRLKTINESMKKYTKWNTINVSRVEKVIRIIEKGIQLYTSDSKQQKAIKNSYLPGRLLNIIKSRYTSITNERR